MCLPAWMQGNRELMLNLASKSDRSPAGAPDYRAYVIGDVHGRLEPEPLGLGVRRYRQHRPGEIPPGLLPRLISTTRLSQKVPFGVPFFLGG